MEIVLKYIRAFMFRLENVACIWGLRIAYAFVLRRLRRDVRERKLRVVFVVNEIGKWKMQTLYEKMVRSRFYDPVIGITIADADNYLTLDEQRQKLKATKDFFEGLDMPVAMMYDPNTRQAKSMVDLKADIVFYQQPYLIFDKQKPRAVAITALTCYVPYYVSTYVLRAFEYGMPFHKHLWRYFALNNAVVRIYRGRGRFFCYAGKMIGTGNPCLDGLWCGDRVTSKDDLVIYAPHWAFAHTGNENGWNISTFLWAGDLVLGFAKQHPNIRWAFRPHPTLKVALRRSGAWSEERVEKYWNDWASLGKMSLSGPYEDLFSRSKALITDCGSFLTEYPITGKPLIHLISDLCRHRMHRGVRKLSDAFYKVRTPEELQSVFNALLVRGEDPNQGLRMSILERMKAETQDAAGNIVACLNEALAVNEDN